MTDRIQQEETAQRVVAALLSGPKTTQMVADLTNLSMAEARVILQYLEDRGRVVRSNTLGQLHPLWVCVEGP